MAYVYEPRPVLMNVGVIFWINQGRINQGQNVWGLPPLYGFKKP